MNQSIIPFLLTLTIVWSSIGVTGYRYIGLVRENERARLVVISTPPPRVENLQPHTEVPPADSQETKGKAPEIIIAKDPDTVPVSPPYSSFTNPRFLDLLKDEEWRKGRVMVVLVSNMMDERNRGRLVGELDQIRKDQSGKLVGNDVFVVGRDRLWFSNDWLTKAPPSDAFETSPKGFAEAFMQVQHDLDEVDLRRDANPARRLVLWQSSTCPRSLENRATPRVNQAQIIWSGGQFSDRGDLLDKVFGEDEHRVTLHGPLLDNLANTVKNVLSN